MPYLKIYNVLRGIKREIKCVAPTARSYTYLPSRFLFHMALKSILKNGEISACGDFRIIMKSSLN